MSGAEDKYKEMVRDFSGEKEFAVKLEEINKDINEALKEKAERKKRAELKLDIGRAKVLIDKGEYKEAEGILAGLGKSHPDNGEISRLLDKARLLERRKREAEFKRLSSETSNLIRRGDLSGAEDKYKQMVKLFSEEKFSVKLSSLEIQLALALSKEEMRRRNLLFKQKMKQARRFVAGKDYFQAKDILDKLVKEYPKNKKAVSLLNYTEKKLSAAVSRKEKKVGDFLDKWERILGRQKKTEKKKIIRHPVEVKALFKVKESHPAVLREQPREQSINEMLKRAEQGFSLKKRMEEIESGKEKTSLRREKELKEVEKKVFEIKKAEDYIDIGRYKQASAVLKRLKALYPEDEKINSLLSEIK